MVFDHVVDTAFAADAKSGGLELRDYFAAGCGHCKTLAPTWDEAAAAYKGPVTFRKIECLDANWEPIKGNEQLCKDISGFPTIKMYHGDKELVDFEGPRTKEGLIDFAKQHEGSSAQAAAIPLPMILGALWIPEIKKERNFL